MRDVTTRQSSANGGEQAVREQPDEEFQQVMALSVQDREFAFGQPQIPRHGEHVDERRTNVAVLCVDLGQDFEGLARNGQDADYLSGLESLVDAGQDGQTEAPSRALGGGVETAGIVLRQAVLSDRQDLPLLDGVPLRAGERHDGGTIPCRRYPPQGRDGRSRVGRRRRP